MKRHSLTYGKGREMIRSGEFIPASGSFKYAHWETTHLKSMLLGMSSHIIDLALSFFGKPVSVTSIKHQSERAISLSVTLQFESGKWAHLWLDASQPRIQEHVEISGSMDGKNALLTFDNVDHMELHRQTHPSRGIDVLAPTLADIAPAFNLADIQRWRPDYALPNCGQTRHFIQGFAGEVREFCDAVIDKREPYPSMDDVINTMRVIDAISKNPDGATQLVE